MAEEKSPTNEDECATLLTEVRAVFPKLQRINIEAAYEESFGNNISSMSGASKKDLDFDPEALLTGEETKVVEKKVAAENYAIHINQKLKRIRTQLLRKQVVQHTIMHHLLMVEEDLENLQENQKGKRIVTAGRRFRKKLFERYNQLRQSMGIAEIEKPEHLDAAIHRILHTINWWQ